MGNDMGIINEESGSMCKEHKEFPGGIRETKKRLNHEIKPPNRKSNQGSPKYEAGVLTTTPRR